METAQLCFEEWVKTLTPLTPVIKWAGGKRKLIPALCANLPTFTGYHEPFVGGGALWLHLRPSKAAISDSNPEIINLYQQIKFSPYRLMSELDRLAEGHSEEQYNTIRAMDRSGDYHPNAARFVYLNKTCFNGLTRYNSKGQFNVPKGDGVGPFYDSEDIMALHNYLKENKVTLDCQDFMKSLRNVQEKDLVYLDPPYDPLSKTSNFVGYTKNGFTSEDQIRVQQYALEAHRKGAHVMISNHDTPFIRSLFPQEIWNVKQVGVSRSVNSKGDGRGKIDELIISNF